MSMDETLFNSLTAAESQEDIIDILSTIYIKKELAVDDIMSTDFGIISPEANLKKLTDEFYLKNTSYLPVIDDKQKFIGEVRINDLIAVGIPDYAVSIGNLSFLKSFVPFEKLMLAEEDIKVKDIMKKPAVTLNTGATVVEAALKMTTGNYRHIPVVEDGRLLGILNILDILNKVLRS
jgi:CBS domain-containing protein